MDLAICFVAFVLIGIMVSIDNIAKELSLKHQPFGVVKDKYFANYQTHRAFTCLVTNGCHFRGYEDETFENSFKNLLFADGTPFGVKVEK